MTLNTWLRKADVDDGNKPGKISADNAGLHDLKRRNRLLEQENDPGRRAAAARIERTYRRRRRQGQAV